jgi:hypothetical protein
VGKQRWKQKCLSPFRPSLDVPLELLLNFHELKLVAGISRLLLPGANKP